MSHELLHDTLSTREYQVMLMIAKVQSLKEIAAELSISAKTVGTSHTRILAKMGLGNNIPITLCALLNELVDWAALLNSSLQVLITKRKATL